MTITLAFTKGADKTDTLLVTRADGATERIDCPKQGIVPHDMVHYAVESCLTARGFLGRVASGETATFAMAAEAEGDGVERLVEVIQGDAWSGGAASAAELIDLYRVTCEARGCPMLAVDAVAIEMIRARLAELTRDWNAVAVGGKMTLGFDV
jgi:hypothetical protein